MVCVPELMFCGLCVWYLLALPGAWVHMRIGVPGCEIGSPGAVLAMDGRALYLIEGDGPVLFMRYHSASNIRLAGSHS